MLAVAVEALVALEAITLLFEVLAYRSLLLYILMQECTIIPIPTIATEPKGTHL